MKKMMSLCLSLCLTAALAAPAYALEYTIDAPEGPSYGTPTSIEVVHTADGGAMKNEDVSKNAALIPPGFGTPSMDAMNTGTYLTPNLAPGGMPATGTVIGGSGSPVVEPGSTVVTLQYRNHHRLYRGHLRPLLLGRISGYAEDPHFGSEREGLPEYGQQNTGKGRRSL